MLTLYAVTALAGWSIAWATLARGLRRIPRLRAGSVPAVSASVAIVVAARNEERVVEAALRSLLAQRHGRLRIVAVNDRSDDRTGPILDRLSRAESRLDVLHVSDLPPDWLGKNHALHLGAGRADAEFLVFTDADIVMHPDAVAAAVGYAVRRGLDHAAVFPRMRADGPLLNAAIGVFTVLFSLRFRPWRAADPGSRAHVGIGAFNLVRRAAYERMGGHASISLRPDDDLRLGRALKEAGCRSEAVFGDRLLSVEWYRSVREMVRGLRKNAYAAADYNTGLIVLLVTLLLAFHVAPFAAALLSDGMPRAGFALAALLAVSSFDLSARRFGVRRAAALLYPFGALIVAYAVVAATVRALVTGGVEWRGTVYPLERLRRASGPGGRHTTRWRTGA
ncbi:MAG TPA: glycosyltransferase [Longimicrobiales bacterium]|nr:glycosyltransferase [Longimicrobiales bacterium]